MMLRRMDRNHRAAVALACFLGASLVACSATTGGVCPPEPPSATCRYYGYGSTCDIPCDFPSSCTFRVSVEWSGGSYCCGAFEGGYQDCVCEAGHVVCATNALPGTRRAPTSSCEFCILPDSGFQDGGVDAGSDDAGETDAGDTDASIP